MENNPLIIAEAGSTSKFMAKYGQTLSWWGLVEHSLCRVFVNLVAAKSVEVAGACFFSVPSFRDKLRMVDAAVKVLMNEETDGYLGLEKSKKLKAEWSANQQLAIKAGEVRNKLAHMHFWLNGEGVPYGSFSIYGMSKIPVKWNARKGHVITEERLLVYEESFREVRGSLDVLAEHSREWLR